MVNDVVRSVAKVLRELYPEAEVYTEAVKQGLEAPCFCICCGKPEMRRFMGKRWRYSLPVTLYCFPEEEGEGAELNEIFEQLFGALELIDCFGPMRASGMHASVSDGVGVFCVDYDFFVEWEKAADTSGMMLELKLLGK